mmetsp:Transcript_2809/g.2472  ORF Transcript_2809/g.2472 Transcript_2809/m.2472 type:complete len:446 (-) Transcript_2809:55-1392(-)
MSFKDFRILETIGKGSFASVYKVIRKSDNKVYALKRVKINKMSKKELEDALNEIRFLASIRQKNIVGFLEAFLESNDSELCIVMEYCGNGDLAQKIERYKRRRQYIDENVIWKYLVQCLKALAHLHEKGICHRDLKAANTFLSDDGSVKIGDMNVSKRLNKGLLQTQIGTPYYMSPEIWNNRPYDFSSDMWSLGCMFYELASLRPPFTGDSFPTLKKSVVSGRFTNIPRKYSDSLGKVISQMLKVNPKDRPTASGLLQSHELASKLQFDDSINPLAIDDSFKNNRAKLMETIRLPVNLKKLNIALPKPCYPDVRPNSPSSWIVADQQQRPVMPPPPPPVSNNLIDQLNNVENVPPPINRDEVSKKQALNDLIKKEKDSKPQSDINQKIVSNIPNARLYHPAEPVSNAIPSVPYARVKIPVSVPTAPAGSKPPVNPRYQYHQHRMW